MLIDKFHEKMCRRFRNNLKKTGDIKFFDEWCHEKLKKYQGEILGFVYHEFDETIRTNSHPNHAVILDMCRKKERMQSPKKAVACRDEKSDACDKNAEQMIDEYKNSLQYGPACVELIAGSALEFIRTNLKFPEQNDISDFRQIRDEFIYRLLAMKDGKIDTELGGYYTGCMFYLNEVTRVREHFMLNPMPPNYRNFTFLEHENRDMDYPVEQYDAIEYNPEIPMEHVGEV